MALRQIVFCLCFAALCLQLTECANWALLVAGSNGYYNYRHQADICHAYHILRNHGVPQENIVTMMYDDIAYSEENPIQGNIINRPNGPNVYPGVVIDYKGKDVTPAVFLAALSGNEKEVKRLTGKDGKVIKSGPGDHVFVNFADHGATGLLAFPVEVLHARKLMKTLKAMYQKKSYKKLVLYVEACESGSMFYDLLPDNINIFASTAANRSQSSYACYYDDKRGTYLGDVYSVNWMEDSDKENLETETLQKQFTITRSETNTSQVKEYGDMSISQMTVAEFQGDQTSVDMRSRVFVDPTRDAVPAREAQATILQRKKELGETAEERMDAALKLQQLEEHNRGVDALFRGVVEWLDRENTLTRGNVLRFHSTESMYDAVESQRHDITQWDCYEHAVDTLMDSCPKMRLSQDYHALSKLYMLVNLCETGHPGYALATAVRVSALRHPLLCRY